MNRYTPILIAGSIVMLEVLLARPAMAQPPMQPISVTVSNQAGVPADVMAGALAEVAHVYRAIGVQVIWTDDASTAIGNRYFVNIVPERLGHRWTTAALGTTMVGGILAYVVFERVERFSNRWGNDIRTTLGLAIAHELGHLLLRDGSHTVSGLMSPTWNAVDGGLAASRRLLFWPAEGANIRKSLANAR